MPFYHHPLVTMLYYLYKEYITRISKRTILWRPRASNVPPVTYNGGDIDDGTAATDVSILKNKSSSKLVKNLYMTSSTR